MSKKTFKATDYTACKHDPPCDSVGGSPSNRLCDYLGHPGSGWLERKANGALVYHAPWLRKPAPFTMTEPKARVETEARALVRLKKECLTPDDLGGRGTRGLGKFHAQGYVMTSTNGHWALLEYRDMGTLPKSDEQAYLRISKDHKPVKLDNPELHNAIKRAKTMMDTRSRAIGLVSLSIGLVGVHSSDSDAGEFTETVEEKIKGNLTSKLWGVTLDYNYLEPVLGCWPLTLWIKDDESALILEPVGKSWRMVIMPLRGTPAPEMRKRFAEVLS
jgi:hypothetical protein